jgi:hypothetical protein
MKRAVVVLGTVALLLAVWAAAGYAGGKPDLGSPEKYDRAVVNLIIGIKSDNTGLRESAAFMLGELQASEAVLPLMKILKDSEKESSRIVAALALCRIGDGRGLYAVKQAVRFDESEVVKQRCAWFYQEFGQAQVVAGSQQDVIFASK